MIKRLLVLFKEKWNMLTYSKTYSDFESDGILIQYDGTNFDSLLKFDQFEKFLKQFPNYKYLFNEKQLEKFHIKDVLIQSEDEEKLFEKYKTLQCLDDIFSILSISKKTSMPRCYEYEIFTTKKIIIKSSVCYKTVVQLDSKTINQLDGMSKKFLQLNKSQLELEKSFLLKAIEDVFKQNKAKKLFTFDDVLENLEEVYQEHELLSKSYIDKLDTNAMRFDYQKKIQEVNDKLQSVLSDIQNKMLIPPIALILAYANIFDKEGTVKGLAMLTLFAFFGIVTYYGYNQVQIIQNYQNNIKSWARFYKKFISKNYTKLSSDFVKSSKIATSIRSSIWISIGVNWVLYIIAFAFMF